jgi:small subunit ribosomal protein S2
MFNSNITKESLLKSKVHYGHMRNKKNSKMAQYILFEKKKGLSIINLEKTMIALNKACDYFYALSKAGKKIMFVATKDQAKEVVSEVAKKNKMPYMTQKWIGGTLTNFSSMKQKIKSLVSFFENKNIKKFTNKKEELVFKRNKERSNNFLHGILDMNKMPSVLFVVDVNKELSAVKEAKILNIPVVAIIDTNVDPDFVDLGIPGNDDSVESISVILNSLSFAIEKGLNERYQELKDKNEFDYVNDLEKIAKDKKKDEKTVKNGLKFKKENTLLKKDFSKKIDFDEKKIFKKEPNKFEKNDFINDELKKLEKKNKIYEKQNEDKVLKKKLKRITVDES